MLFNICWIPGYFEHTHISEYLRFLSSRSSAKCMTPYQSCFKPCLMGGRTVCTEYGLEPISVCFLYTHMTFRNSEIVSRTTHKDGDFVFIVIYDHYMYYIQQCQPDWYTMLMTLSKRQVKYYLSIDVPLMDVHINLLS